jgi:hypothetical protein
MIMEAPHRFDLVPTSCVNKEVVTFNRRLQKIVKSFNHAEIVNMSTRRERFTRQAPYEWLLKGLHHRSHSSKAKVIKHLLVSNHS